MRTPLQFLIDLRNKNKCPICNTRLRFDQPCGGFQGEYCHKKHYYQRSRCDKILFRIYGEPGLSIVDSKLYKVIEIIKNNKKVTVPYFNTDGMPYEKIKNKALIRITFS